ncbi:MAG: Fic family protein [Bacillota bacterium]|nr:Fic family protein [Bacillota bacterium]
MENERNDYYNYIRVSEPEKEYKAYAWNTAIGLQEVDGLKVSSYLIDIARKHIDGEISIDQAKDLVKNYYQAKGNRNSIQGRTIEADLVAANIAETLSEDGFVFSVAQLISIHKNLFENIFESAGKIREYNISKEEWILDGESVKYGNAPDIKELLEYDFKQEKEFSYKGLSIDQIIKHLARFTANLWQIHPFEEGNTRTVAVFLIKYLKTLGFNVTNDIFANNAWYFRNALVRANYSNLTKGVYETTEYIERLLRNLLLNESNSLQNRDLHVEEEENIFSQPYAIHNVGRPIANLPDNWNEIISKWKTGEISATKAMELTGVKKTTFYKYSK